VSTGQFQRRGPRAKKLEIGKQPQCYLQQLW